MYKNNKIVSKYESINNSYNNLKKRNFLPKKILKALFSIETLAHIASVLALTSLYIAIRNKDFTYIKITDSIAIIATIFLSFIGAKQIYTKISKESQIKVTFNELHDLLTVARFEAENSIINIGGDISWLKHDLDSLRKIKEEHNDVDIKIYYDKDKLSDSTKKLIKNVRKENIIELIPYPSGITPPNIRCMITDYDCYEIQNCKIYTYSKIDGGNTSNKSDDKFEWRENTIKTHPQLYEIIASFLQILYKVGRRQMIVGITGINNSGKTSVINECQKILSKNFKVKVVPDTFYQLPREKNLKKTNKEIIYRQTIELCKNNDSDILIFDRTPFDNFMYLLMREIIHDFRSESKTNTIISEYNYLIQNLMRCYNLIYKIKRKDENGNCKTKYVSINERNCLLDLYNKYYTYYIPEVNGEYEIRGGDKFSEDVKEVAQTIAECIQNYYYT